MSKPILRRLTVATALATALWLGGSPAAHAGSFAIELPAVLDTGLFDCLAQWLGSLWASDETPSRPADSKSLPSTSGDGSSSPTAPTGSTGTTDQGGAIDPDGVKGSLD